MPAARALESGRGARAAIYHALFISTQFLYFVFVHLIYRNVITICDSPDVQTLPNDGIKKEPQEDSDAGK